MTAERKRPFDIDPEFYFTFSSDSPEVNYSSLAPIVASIIMFMPAAILFLNFLYNREITFDQKMYSIAFGFFGILFILVGLNGLVRREYTISVLGIGIYKRYLLKHFIDWRDIERINLELVHPPKSPSYYVINIVSRGKTYSITKASTKDLKTAFWYMTQYAGYHSIRIVDNSGFLDKTMRRVKRKRIAEQYRSS